MYARVPTRYLNATCIMQWCNTCLSVYLSIQCLLFKINFLCFFFFWRFVYLFNMTLSRFIIFIICLVFVMYVIMISAQYLIFFRIKLCPTVLLLSDQTEDEAKFQKTIFYVAMALKQETLLFKFSLPSCVNISLVLFMFL